MHDSLSNRFNYALSQAKLTPASLAATLNRSAETVRRWIRNGEIPDRFYTAIERATGFSTHWIVTGQGSEKSLLTFIDLVPGEETVIPLSQNNGEGFSMLYFDLTGNQVTVFNGAVPDEPLNITLTDSTTVTITRMEDTVKSDTGERVILELVKRTIKPDQ